jgi:hypothetical protein
MASVYDSACILSKLLQARLQNSISDVPASSPFRIIELVIILSCCTHIMETMGPIETAETLGRSRLAGARA